MRKIKFRFAISERFINIVKATRLATFLVAIFSFLIYGILSLSPSNLYAATGDFWNVERNNTSNDLNFYLNAGGTNGPTLFQIKSNGVGALSGGGSQYASTNNRLQPGALNLGDYTKNYGGGNNWNANMAGLFFETQANTEIAVHDAGSRVASLMYYEGDAVNKITIGRDMGWGQISTVDIGNILKINPNNTGSSSTNYIRGGTNHLVLNANGDLYLNYPDSAAQTMTRIGESLFVQRQANVGVGTSTPAQKLDVNGNIGVPEFTSFTTGYMGIVSPTGNMADTVPYYFGIGREPGAWDGSSINGSPYPDLVVSNHTGIRLAAHGSYGGVSIYDQHNWANSIWSSAGTQIARFRANQVGGSYILTKLGIGSTANPGADLHIKQSDDSQGGYGGIRLERSGGGGFARIFHGSNDLLHFFGNNNTSQCILQANSTWSCVSDGRKKENIQSINISALDIISKLRPSTFTIKSNGSHGAGFIAQEVMEVLPGAVNYDKETDNYSVADSYFTPYLVKSMQELNAKVETESKAKSEQIESLSQQIKSQQEQIETLKKEIEIIKESI